MSGRLVMRSTRVHCFAPSWLQQGVKKKRKHSYASLHLTNRDINTIISKLKKIEQRNKSKCAPIKKLVKHNSRSKYSNTRKLQTKQLRKNLKMQIAQTNVRFTCLDLQFTIVADKITKVILQIHFVLNSSKWLFCTG